MEAIKQPLTNAQLEILKVFSHNLSDKELKEFRKTIARYFAEKAINSADKTWDEKGLTNQDVDQIIQTKIRKTKK